MLIDLNSNNVKVSHSNYVMNDIVAVDRASVMGSKELENEVKQNLIMLLARHLMENGHVEFTKIKDPTNHDNIFRARIVTVDKNVVGELRKNRII